MRLADCELGATARVPAPRECGWPPGGRALVLSVISIAITVTGIVGALVPSCPSVRLSSREKGRRAEATVGTPPG
jgi:hypothetical protein